MTPKTGAKWWPDYYAQKVADPAWREHRAEIQRQNREKHRDRYLARAKVNNAIRRGDLTRPDRCELCGQVGRVQGHHHDYSKPLEVTWLCKRCHVKEDRREDHDD